MTDVICRECYGSSSVKNTYVEKTDGFIEVVTDKERWQSFSQFFRAVFLPQGYPESVSRDYLEYQIWDTIQAFSSSITGSLATQAVLAGVGVGDETATVLAATITWLLKDGTGMLGRIWFAWIQGSYLDCDCKRWRLFADILNDLAIFLDILASIFVGYFRTLVCLAGISRAIVGVAGGATRAAITQHQARRNNMADVSAKDGSQETLVNLAGLICSLIIMPLVTGNYALIWALFLIFTCIHLFANYRAVTVVTMETFNQARLHIVVDDLLSRTDWRDILGVKETNLREPVLWKTRRYLKIHLGCTFGRLLLNSQRKTYIINRSNYSTVDTRHSANIPGYQNNSLYLLSVDLQKREIAIVLHTDAGWQDQLKACYHAEIIEYCFKIAQHSMPPTFCDSKLLAAIVSSCRQRDVQSIHLHSNEFVEQTWLKFVESLEVVGWKPSPVLLCADEWRAEWNSNSMTELGNWKKSF